MTTKNNVIFKIVLMLAILFMTQSGNDLFAQIGLPDGGDVLDEPAAPIDGFIAIALAIGGYFGIRRINKKQ